MPFKINTNATWYETSGSILYLVKGLPIIFLFFLLRVNFFSDKELRYITKSEFPELIKCEALCESLSYSKKFPVNLILDGNPDIHPRVCEKLTSPSFQPMTNKQLSLSYLERQRTQKYYI